MQDQMILTIDTKIKFHIFFPFGCDQISMLQRN